MMTPGAVFGWTMLAKGKPYQRPAPPTRGRRDDPGARYVRYRHHESHRRLIIIFGLIVMVAVNIAIAMQPEGVPLAEPRLGPFFVVPSAVVLVLMGVVVYWHSTTYRDDDTG